MSWFGKDTLAVIEVMSGPMDGMRVNIRKQVVSIGRLEKYMSCLNCGKAFDDGSKCPKCKSPKIKAEENDIVLSLDKYASRIHAKITFEGKRFWLQDLESTNGTWLVKGESMKQIVGKEPLGHNDTFLIGHTYLKLETEGLK